MKLLPARRPQMSQASVAGFSCGALRPVHSLKMASCSGVIGSANNAAMKARHEAQVKLRIGHRSLLVGFAPRAVSRLDLRRACSAMSMGLPSTSERLFGGSCATLLIFSAH